MLAGGRWWCGGVSISALSDRIAQLGPVNIVFLRAGVSISALSDRIAQPGLLSGNAKRLTGFNIRSFGSNCSAWHPPGAEEGDEPFQYPLFRIELLSATGVASSDQLGKFQYPLFRIELLSGMAAAARFIAHLFQYPLFRIELLSVARLLAIYAMRCFNIRSFGSNCSAANGVNSARPHVAFQYPLFRIELLSRSTYRTRCASTSVSISALSDRIAQRQEVEAAKVRDARFNIRSFGSNCSAHQRCTPE